MMKSMSRKRCVHIMMVYTGGCNGCEIEVLDSLFSPYYDLEQYRIALTFNPREADILLVTGPVTVRCESQLKSIYERIPEPKAVIAVGACAIVGGIYKNMYGELGPSDQVRAPLKDIIPVDGLARGCAPNPEEIIMAVSKVIPIIAGKK
jgi:energy-converting hydrogenase B subunit M